MAKKKKVKKKFDQSFRKSQEHQLFDQEHQPVPASLKPDLLDPGTKIGFILMGYFLFIAGSIGCLVLGYAGSEKRGSYEVRFIGWVLMLLHAIFFALFVIDVGTTGVLPIQITFIIIMLYPIILIITGLFSRNAVWGNSIKSIGLTILIPNIIVLWFLNPSIIWDQTRANEIITMSNIQKLSKALEKYEIDNEGTFPQSVNELVSNNYIGSTPTNPFTDLPMIQIEFGADNFPGNFTYIPVQKDNKIIGYYLFCYGDRSNPGQDINNDNQPDQVISVLSGIGGIGMVSYNEYQKIVSDFPTLNDVLSEL